VLNWRAAGTAGRHSDENAAAQATRLGRPELGPWPEQLLGLLAEFGSRLETAQG
jgi:hypothetical protein